MKPMTYLNVLSSWRQKRTEGKPFCRNKTEGGDSGEMERSASGPEIQDWLKGNWEKIQKGT